MLGETGAVLISALSTIIILDTSNISFTVSVNTLIVSSTILLDKPGSVVVALISIICVSSVFETCKALLTKPDEISKFLATLS